MGAVLEVSAEDSTGMGCRQGRLPGGGDLEVTKDLGSWWSTTLLCPWPQPGFGAEAGAAGAGGCDCEEHEVGAGAAAQGGAGAEAAEGGERLPAVRPRLLGLELGCVRVRLALLGLLLVPRIRGCLSDFVSGPGREMRETNGLLREEVEGLQRKLGRQEKMQENLVDLELEKEVRA